MRAMMPATRVTLLARSEITSELLLVWAMSCAPCGSSGRRIGTSSAAAMCRSGTICVTMASPDSAVATVLPPSAWAIASGTIFTMLPAGTAAKPCTRSTERNTS